MNFFSALFVIINLLSVFIFAQPVNALVGSDNSLLDKQDYLPTIGYYDGVFGGGNTADLSAGDNVMVAVIDQGVWTGSPDLTGNIWTNTKEISQNGIDDDHNGYVDDFYGWNFLDNNSDITPKGTHGTSVAGIIAANNQHLAGIAPHAKIMPLIACDSNGACPIAAVSNAIRYAVDNGANIINLSLAENGFLGYSDEYNAVIKYAYVHDVVIVASAGNGDTLSAGSVGQNLDLIRASPVSNDVDGFNMVIGVGAETKNIPVNTLVPPHLAWSNYGTKVDAWAPGDKIVVLTVPSYESAYQYIFPNGTSIYAKYADGTSFSAPMISATAALLKAQHSYLKNWEIIDAISSQTHLDVKSLLLPSQYVACKITSLAPSTFTSGTQVIATGQNFKSDIAVSLYDASGATISYDARSHFTFDANHGIWDTSALSLPTGDYKLSFSMNQGRVDACSKDLTFHFQGTNLVPINTNVNISNISGTQIDDGGKTINVFTDVDSSTPYKDAINYVFSKKIVKGYADGTFKPIGILNRAELLKIVVLAKYPEPVATFDKSCFKDVQKGNWYTPYICFAKGLNIVEGYNDGTFKPEQKITYPEALKITLEGLGYSPVQSTTLWYQAYLDLAASMSVGLGLTPGQAITRGEMAQLIMNVMTYGQK